MTPRRASTKSMNLQLRFSMSTKGGVGQQGNLQVRSAGFLALFVSCRASILLLLHAVCNNANKEENMTRLCHGTGCCLERLQGAGMDGGREGDGRTLREHH
jgi:hypothetical protein